MTAPAHADARAANGTIATAALVAIEHPASRRQPNALQLAGGGASARVMLRVVPRGFSGLLVLSALLWQSAALAWAPEVGGRKWVLRVRDWPNQNGVFGFG